MHTLERAPRWLGIAGTHWQAIIKRADDIRTLKDRGCAVEALEVEHEAIELILTSLSDAVHSGAEAEEVIEILNASIDFCGAHFADEEEVMRESGDLQAPHISAHRHLLAKFVAARRRAAGECLSLATLDAVDLLHEFHEHVRTFDRTAHPLFKNRRTARATPPSPAS